MSSPPEAVGALPRFAIRACPELIAAAAALPATDRIADLAAERVRARRVADAYAASVVDGLILALVDGGPGVSGGTATLLRNLAGVVSTVAASALGQGIARADADALLALRRFLHVRLRATPEAASPGELLFPLDAATARAIEAGARAVAGRAWADARPALADAMAGVIDLAIRHHLEEPIALLRPGFVVRQALGAGVAAIRSGAHAVLRRAIASEREAQLAALSRFLGGSLRPPAA
jgi:hypothetical protein